MEGGGRLNSRREGKVIWHTQVYAIRIHTGDTKTAITPEDNVKERMCSQLLSSIGQSDCTAESDVKERPDSDGRHGGQKRAKMQIGIYSSYRGRLHNNRQ